jgi:hypothetical protein
MVDMLSLIAIVAATPCAPLALDVRQAEKLVLAAPNIRASVAERGAHPFFESVDRGKSGWTFTVNAANPCATANPCSNLLGHYAVDRRTGEIEDLDAGLDGEPVSSPRIRQLQRTMGCRR